MYQPHRYRSEVLSLKITNIKMGNHFFDRATLFFRNRIIAMSLFFIERVTLSFS